MRSGDGAIVLDSSSSRATPEAARNPAIGEIAAAEVGLCTVCDLVYLPRLLVMERSLRRVWPSQRLHVVCLDEATRQLLDARDGIVAIAVDEVERSDPAVADTRPFRSRRAYAWTLKPSVCLHVLG